MVAMKELESFCSVIARDFSPEKIILFGSYAEAKATSDSDIDLLVIMRFEGSPVEQSVEIRMTVPYSFPLDLLVRTPEMIRERLRLGDPFITEIVNRGRVLYEAGR